MNPFLLLYVTTCLALLYAWFRWPKARRALLLVVVPFVAMSMTVLPPVSYLCLGSLEWSYPPVRDRPTGVEAIVVLSGSLRRPDPGYPFTDLGDDTLKRCLVAASIYRNGPPCPVLVSGGKVDSSWPGPTLAAAMREFLVQHGVAETDILIEAVSRNTHENAVESARILRDRGIQSVVLVTDAIHLRRAVLCFRKEDIRVVPRGSSYRATSFSWKLANLFPSEGAARGVSCAVHEWVGMAWYWYRGWL